MSATHAHTHNMDNLQAMLNMVLISSGTYIKTHQSAKNSPQAQLNLKRSVTAASERFHDTLDELENEILHAQTVLRRDLAVMRADRKKREAVAKEKEAERARLAAEKSAPPLKQDEPTPPPPPPPASAPVDVKPEPPVKSSTPIETPPDPPAPVAKVEAPPLPPAPDAPAPALALASEPAPVEDAPMQNPDSNMAHQETEIDFDALFGDAMDTSGGDGDQGDLNLDSHGDLNLDQGPDLSFNLDDSGHSLLRGLEDFANSGDGETKQNNATKANMDLDFAMPDLADVTANASTEQSNDAKPSNTEPQQTANDDLNLDDMTTDNLDDLFDMEYTNPEATQFDDAFFGFGE